MNKHTKMVIEHRNWENQNRMGEAIFRHEVRKHGEQAAIDRGNDRYMDTLQIRAEARERYANEGWKEHAEDHYRECDMRTAERGLER